MMKLKFRKYNKMLLVVLTVNKEKIYFKLQFYLSNVMAIISRNCINKLD